MLGVVRLEEQDAQAVRRQLERILSNAAFARSERLSGFLRLVVERRLEGRDGEIKESLIAVEVFGRRPDYDPQRDSIVRTEAGRLRARLIEYYAGEGSADPVIIELPKGGYAPVFRQRGPARYARKTSFLGLRLTLVLASLTVALGALLAWRFQQEKAPVPIAVLPLMNLNQDPADDYLADGLTDELIRNLSIIDGLAVRSQTSSFAMKGKPNVREAGRQLQADYILEGSVLRSGQRLRINARLVRVRDDFAVWSGRYDQEFADVLGIQDEIARGIVNSLRLKLGRGHRRYETSAQAYDLYLRARAVTIRHGIPGYSQSIGPFEEAIANDPSFAPAYAGLAVAHAVRSDHFGYDHAEELAKMRAAAEKAIRLDPLLAEAHIAMGMAASRDTQWEQSEKSFRQAMELDPSGSESHFLFAAYVLAPLGRMAEALRQLHIAERTDPLSPRIHFNLAWVLISTGQYKEAFSHCEKLPADFWAKSGCLSRARLWEGKIGEAVRIMEAANDSRFPPDFPYLPYLFARAGRREELEKIAPDLSPIQQAAMFAGLGDKERAFEALDGAAALGPFRIGLELTTPEFGLLRGDPRLQALRRKVGLPE